MISWLTAVHNRDIRWPERSAQPGITKRQPRQARAYVRPLKLLRGWRCRRKARNRLLLGVGSMVAYGVCLKLARNRADVLGLAGRSHSSGLCELGRHGLSAQPHQSRRRRAPREETTRWIGIWTGCRHILRRTRTRYGRMEWMQPGQALVIGGLNYAGGGRRKGLRSHRQEIAKGWSVPHNPNASCSVVR